MIGTAISMDTIMGTLNRQSRFAYLDQQSRTAENGMLTRVGGPSRSDEFAEFSGLARSGKFAEFVVLERCAWTGESAQARMLLGGLLGALGRMMSLIRSSILHELRETCTSDKRSCSSAISGAACFVVSVMNAFAIGIRKAVMR